MLMIDTNLFRKAMGRFATGITVVSIKDSETGEERGVTVNAFMSLSLDPLLITISLRNEATMNEILMKNDQFGISVLAEEQQDYSMIFSNQKKTKEPIQFDYIDKTPVIPDAIVQLVCEKESEVVAGDHTIYIARVKQLKTREGRPLIYFGGNYRSLN